MQAWAAGRSEPRPGVYGVCDAKGEALVVVVLTRIRSGC